MSVAEKVSRMFLTLPPLIFCALLLCTAARAQDSSPAPRVRSNPPRHDTQSVSDLELGNLSHVAASSAQVREVLLKEPGILVELKRWVAKEASLNSQIVDDSSLSDQAIIDRLENDIAFRSIATRLVQKYGYLLPSVNPDSPVGKEQEFILKERARRLVQTESQEDSENMQRPYEARDNQQDRNGNRRQRRSTNCDARRDDTNGSNDNNNSDDNCDQLQQDLNRVNTPLDEENPNGAPYTPYQRNPYQDQPQSSNGQLLRAQSQTPMEDNDQLEGSGSGAQLGSTDDVSDRAQGSLDVAMRSGAIDGLSSPPEKNGLDVPGALDGPASFSSLRPDGASANDRNLNKPIRLVRNTRFNPFSGREIPSVAMIHKPTPYADIPSLYDMYVQASPNDRKPERFGLDVFRYGTRDLDAIPMDLPVGPEYVVGPGDGLSINLWGGVSGRLTRVVDRQGRINLPETGPILVSGRSLGDVQEAVENSLRTQYRDTSADVSLAKLRTVRVYVVGEVAQPGAYDVSSLSTPINALVEAGGITPRGSLRRLQHFRGKQLLEEIDAYDLLLHGVNADAQRLENGDTLLVRSLGPQVTVTGMVRRPAIYELNGEKSLEDVVELAGGILPAAALKHIEVQRLVEHEKHTMVSLNLTPDDNPENSAKQLSGLKIQGGDEIHIFPIAPYNDSTVYLQGHVLRPGKYSYHDGMKLADLLSSYKDLLPEPAGNYAEIIRLNAPDFHPSVEGFDLSAAMTDPAASPKLQAMDTVRIFSRFEFEAPPEVSVDGDVRAPGVYRFSGQAHLRDAIYLAGGISADASLESAQLFHHESNGTLKIFSVNLRSALAGDPAANVLVSPRDRLLVHHNLALSDPPTVYVKGEVAKPGKYPLTSNMRVDDLIQVAGGLKRSADPQTADLTHYAEGDTPAITTRSSTVPLNAVLEGDEKANISLQDGDVLSIRESPGWHDVGASVVIRGEVQHAGSYGIRPNERLSTVLARAGGFGPNAYPYGAVLMRRDVRDLENKAHLDLIERVKVEETHLKALPETDEDAKNAKLTAISESETTLASLQANPPIGRVVIHIRQDLKTWRNTPADVPMQDGDVLVIPKEADFVTVTGQVFNPTAVSYRPGQSAKWYLSQAGGVTGIADKKGVFVIRGDGSVISAKNNSGGLWSGDPLDSPLKAGDTIVVPEKALRVGTRNWQTIFQSAQLASSVALAVAYIHP